MPARLLAAAVAATVIASGAPAAADAPVARTVTVAFKEAPGDRFVQVLHTLMGTRTTRKLDATRYGFGLPARGEANDWSLFFAQLPYVRTVEPAPRVPAADREPPPVTLGPPSPGPGLYLSPNQLLGTHVLVRYRAGAADHSLVAALVDQVYGTRALERTDGGEARLAPPTGASPQVTARVLRLCPYVASAEPAWGR